MLKGGGHFGLNRGTGSGDQARELRAFRSREERCLNRRKRETKPIRVISVTGGKGGVGKTFTVVNLAVALAQAGAEVVVFDGDLGLANVDLMVGVTPLWNIQHVLSGERSIDEIAVEGPYGIKIIPGGTGIASLAQLTYAQRLTLLDGLDQSSFKPDYFLVDTPAGIGPNVLFLNAASNEIVCVVTPEVTSLTDTYALIKVLSQEYGERAVKVLVNNVSTEGMDPEKTAYQVFQKLSLALERFLHLRVSYVGFIPSEGLVRESVSAQRTVVEAFPSSSASRAFYRLAKRLQEDARDCTVKGGLQFFFERLLEVGVG